MKKQILKKVSNMKLCKGLRLSLAIEKAKQVEQLQYALS